MENKLKESIKGNKVVIGTFLFIPSPTVMEILGYSGFDFVIIDTEHGPCGSIDTETLEHIIRAAEISGTTPLVRLPSYSKIMTQKVLDSGALGIIVPGIKTREDAVQMVRATKYAPEGDRGCCSLTRATRYFSAYSEDYWSKANQCTMAIPLIENEEAIKNIEEIVTAKGIDFIFLGPRDLSMSLGYTDVNNPLTKKYIEKVELICEKKDMPLAHFLFPPYKESINNLVDKGAHILVVGGDVGIIYQASKDIVNIIRKKEKK
jgi:4-hydroxy-2-oxoheptanedioate aldolase